VTAASAPHPLERPALDWTALFPFGFAVSVLIVLALIAASFFAAGYFNPYWRRFDMDFMMVYQAFLLNDGRAQTFFDHPGHLNVLLIGGWFHLLHALGMLDVVALSKIPPLADTAQFEHTWTAAVRAGRVLALLIVLAFTGSFALLMRRLVGDWRVAALGTVLVGLSSGVMWHARAMRTDMLAAGLATLGLLLLLIAAREPANRFRFALVGAGALLCTLGVVDKVQALLLVAAWPVVVVFFGVQASAVENGFWRTKRAAILLVPLAVVTLAAAWPAAAMIRFGLLERASSIFPFPPPPLGILGLYQAALAAMVVIAIAAFARVWRVPPLEALAAAFAVTLGVALGLLSMDIFYQPQNVLSVVNPIEHMYVWASYSNHEFFGSPRMASLGLLESLGRGLLDVLARLTFVLHTSSRATVFVEWLVFAGIVVAWLRGRRLLAIQAIGLMAVAWLVNIAGVLRGLKLEYHVFADPTVVIAACWLLAGLPEVARGRWSFRVGVLLIAAHVILSQVEPVKQSYLRNAGPLEACGLLKTYLKRIEGFPFCPPRAPGSG
jgi:hypothetical protein